jgi:hypothetical protein
MADLMLEDVVFIARAARYLNDLIPEAQYSPVTLWRWMKDGRRAESGERIFLEHARLGRKIVTSKQALRRFAQRLASCHPMSSHGISRPASGGIDPKHDLQLSGFFGAGEKPNSSSRKRYPGDRT